MISFHLKNVLLRKRSLKMAFLIQKRTTERHQGPATFYSPGSRTTWLWSDMSGVTSTVGLSPCPPLLPAPCSLAAVPM